MKAVDKQVPWGRPAEDVIARRRERKNHVMHRQRLKDSKSITDSMTPNTTNMTHLRNRAKKRQMADDRLQDIAHENRKLMEKMAAIMRSKGPSSKVDPKKPKQKGEAVFGMGGLNEVTRRKQHDKIASENREILTRIRGGKNTRSFYDHNVMGKDEVTRLKYIKNISKAHQRDTRVNKYNARKKMLAASMPANTMFTPGMPETTGGAGYGQVLDGSMNLSLHTAKQIREDVATKRGMPLPDIINRRPGEVREEKASTHIFKKSNGGGGGVTGKFVMTHTGAVGGNPLAPLSQEESGFDGGEWGDMGNDYDYNSAEGGNFPGRGYSAASGNRPTTTAQSSRSMEYGSGGEEEEE